MNGSVINEFVLWKPIKIVSVIMYSLILILFPVSSFWATILLFALICFWSRIPCMISQFTKDLEVIDFFTVILALNIGGLFAGLFGGMMMLFTRIFGPREWFPFTMRNTVGIFLGGLLSPVVFKLTGSALLTMYAFTGIRYVMLIILAIMFEPEEVGREIMLCGVGSLTAYLTNTVLMSVFEAPLSRILENGVKFDVGLFLFTTVIIGFFYAASRFAKWIETRQAKKAKEAGMKPKEKHKVYALDADTVPTVLFVNTA